MSGGFGKFAVFALIIAIVTHLAVIHILPRFEMNVAMDRLSGHGAHFNQWTAAPRVTEDSRTVVRPSPDFAYAACVYDLSHGPLRIAVGPWRSYWSLSLYGDNSDNYFVVDDREARGGAEITLIKAGENPPDRAPRPVESPSTRGVALIRRLAPGVQDYADAQIAAQDDACAAYVAPTR